MGAARAGALALLACVALAGCTDNTGAIDDMGHNGFDRMTCTDFKSLAMDVQYGTVDGAQRRDRAQKLMDEATHAADPAVRQAAASYTKAFNSGDRKALARSVVAFEKVCMF